MLRLTDRPARLCDGFSRREWLRAGGTAAFGVSLPALLQAQAARASEAASAEPSFGRAKRCIVVFLLGGPPQHETWDPKPEAPPEVRGEFGLIDTATPGLRVGELMPRTAALTDRIAVLRAMSTFDNAHSSSGYWMLTGRPHAPTNTENATPGAPNDWPCLAALVRHLRGDQGGLPAAVRLPEEIWNTGRIVWPGQDAGFLGRASDPWLLTCQPHQADFEVPELALPEDLPALRIDRRRSLLDLVDRHLAVQERGGGAERWNGTTQQAFDLLTSRQGRQAFALDEEPPQVRERYGMNRFGQSVLLARRLVEAGVSIVQVNWTRWETDTAQAPAWDTHAGNAKRLKDDLMPAMDLGYSALLEDLQQRGLLDETLVVWMGEFGRSPRINAAAGRDHWGPVFSVALAGGGIRGGIVHGSSDPLGAYPRSGRVQPQDLAATVLHCLGIQPHAEIHDPLGRPLTASTGEVLRAVL
jgi:hypothetical protein